MEIEMFAELGFEVEIDLSDSADSLNEQGSREIILVPSIRENYEHLVRDEVKTDAPDATSDPKRIRARRSSDLREISGSSPLDEDISAFQIARLQSHPRFVDFRKMPVPILQCFFWPDRWKILCVCIFLNCTRRVQVERVVWKFFERFPSPESLLVASDEEVQEIIKPLGFYKRRTTSLKRMSEDFVGRNWKSPEDLRSVGVYAATCYRMMFLFELGDHAPDDHALVDLYNWMKGLAPRRIETSHPGRMLPDVRR